MKYFTFTFFFIVPILVGCAAHQPTPSSTLEPRIIQRTGPALAAGGAPMNRGLIDQGSSADQEPGLEGEDLLLDDELYDFDDMATDEDIHTVADPLEPFNRAMFYVNDKLYFWAFKPLASGYRAVTPKIMRVGVKNFFTNLLGPVRIVNSILQGDGRSAEAEFTKFIYNSTVGILGFGNPSKKYPALNPDPEDLGQTLGKYGIGDGFYIVWPILGASTLRDTIGDLGDSLLNPVSYVEPVEAYLTVRTVDTVNSLSFRLGDYETLKKAALDPYESMRNAYIQIRQSKLRQ
jgi:phospholipid-binding lipoprotein MlaA